MRKLLFLFAFILVSCDMSEENVVEQEEQNPYTLIVHNTNAQFQVSSSRSYSKRGAIINIRNI